MLPEKLRSVCTGTRVSRRLDTSYRVRGRSHKPRHAPPAELQATVGPHLALQPGQVFPLPTPLSAAILLSGCWASCRILTCTQTLTRTATAPKHGPFPALANMRSTRRRVGQPGGRRRVQDHTASCATHARALEHSRAQASDIASRAARPLE